MTRDREPAPEASPPEPAARARVYEPPGVLWEQAFIALAQVSFDGDFGCEIPGSCEDHP
jgi:hypothetical protein